MSTEGDEHWPGDWASVTAAQQRAWRHTTPDERLRWLEEALTFAADAGALATDRRRRAAAARAWRTRDDPAPAADATDSSDA